MALNNFMPNNGGFNQNLGLVTPMMPQGMIWVKGKAEATNYPMARGTTLPIFDSEDDQFYVKSVDVYGNTQPLRVFKYEEVVQTEDSSTNKTESVSLEDFNALKEELASLKEEIQKANSHNDYKKNNYRKENRVNG